MGMTLREIIFDIGGGIIDGRPFKAVQTGGPSGGCIPAEHLDTPVTYESLIELGSFMGSGGMIVMDETSSMVDVAKFFMEFCMDESCGKCVPCRVGTAQMHELLRQISVGEATARGISRKVTKPESTRRKSPTIAQVAPRVEATGQPASRTSLAQTYQWALPRTREATERKSPNLSSMLASP